MPRIFYTVIVQPRLLVFFVFRLLTDHSSCCSTKARELHWRVYFEKDYNSRRLHTLVLKSFCLPTQESQSVLSDEIFGTRMKSFSTRGAADITPSLYNHGHGRYRQNKTSEHDQVIRKASGRWNAIEAPLTYTSEKPIGTSSLKTFRESSTRDIGSTPSTSSILSVSMKPMIFLNSGVSLSISASDISM